MPEAKLTAYEQSVLDVLSEGHRGVSVVRMAADLWKRGGNSKFDLGDPVGFITWVLEGLNERGYVTYRVAPPEGGGGFYARHTYGLHEYDDLPYDVRLTRKGWVACGYARHSSEVGHTPGLREVRKGDRTDYRTHEAFKNEVSPVEKMPWRQHRAKYPAHSHSYWWWEEESDMTQERAPYTVITPDLEARVMASYTRTGSYQKTSQETNVPVRRVQYIVHDRPRLQRDSESLKNKTLRIIRDEGPFTDVNVLYRAMHGNHGLHNVVHVMHSLRKQGFIDFEQNGPEGNANYYRIRATVPTVDDIAVAPTEEAEEAKAQSDADLVEEFGDHSEIYGPPVETTNGWPELGRIREALARRDQADAKIAGYMEAAEKLFEVDADMAEAVLAKAAEVQSVHLSPVETEYLRYSEAHPDDQ